MPEYSQYKDQPIEYYSYKFQFGQLGKDILLFAEIKAVDSNSYIFTSINLLYKLSVNRDGSISATRIMMEDGQNPFHGNIVFSEFDSDGQDAYLVGSNVLSDSHQVCNSILHLSLQSDNTMPIKPDAAFASGFFTI